MKILFTRFPLESTYGGAEVQTLSLMRGLIADGHAVAFLGSCPTLLRLCREEGIPTVELSIGIPPVTKWGAVSFLWRRSGMRRCLVAAFDNFNDIDAVCMLSLSEKLLLTDHAAKRSKVIWIEHDRVGRWLTQNPYLQDLHTLAGRATTVCVSELSRKMYVGMGWPKERTIAIANGIEDDRWQMTDDRTKEKGTNIQHPTSTISIGTVARLTQDKGVDLLIEAVAAFPKVRLSIVGKGREEPRLRALIQAKNLGDRVTITPTVDSLAAFYTSLDIFVLPSREHDPFGLTAAEALTLGIATIVTDACGIAGYLRNNEDALIVKAGDPRALEEAILAASNDETRASLSKNGEKTAREKFSAKRMVREYETVFTGNSSRA